MVNNKDNSKLIELVNKLFNTKLDEKVVNLLDDEVMVSADAVKLFIPNLSSLVNTINLK